jgi:phosphate starvation-inducible PhoH-like protein
LTLSPRDTSAVFHLEFEDNRFLPLLFGQLDRNLKTIEKKLLVSLVSRGNKLAIYGSDNSTIEAAQVLRMLYRRIQQGQNIDEHDIESAIRVVDTPIGADSESDKFTIKTKKRVIQPRTAGQAEYIQVLRDHELAFGVGPAGTGKTFLAVAVGVDLMLQGKVDKMILSRPAVEAGEKLGFLPGDMKEKVDPFLRPLYDALHDMLPPELVIKKITSGEIEVAPLAFMRGRTLSSAFIILDEAQNATPMQMKMFLTRLGQNSRMVINGDVTQVDLPPNVPSGLVDALHKLENIEGIGIAKLTEKDVVRHHLISKIIAAYDQRAIAS